MEFTMSAGRTAWMVSLAMHGVCIGLLGVAWHSVKPERATMEIVDVQLGDSLDEASAPPTALPLISATPLPDIKHDTSFEPLMPVVHHAPAESPAPAGVAPAVRPPSKPSGAATTFFGVPAMGKSIVYVVDRSASMGLEARLARAIQEVQVSLAHLDARTSFQVITYARTPVAIGPGGLMPADVEHIAQAVDQFTRLQPEGGTDHVRALKAAMLLNPDVIYFLTDEDEFTSDDVRSITEYNRNRSSIHAICLVAPRSSATPIQELARRNRGIFRAAP